MLNGTISVLRAKLMTCVKNRSWWIGVMCVVCFCVTGCGLDEQPEHDSLKSAQNNSTTDPIDDPKDDPKDDPTPTCEETNTCPDDPKDDPTAKPLKVQLREAKQATHRDLGYKGARLRMFGSIDSVSGQVECIYTGERVTANGNIPNHTIMNTEHVWPQSRGATGTAKSDLNHLMPTMSDANNQRSSFFFGKVVNPTWSEGGSKLGLNAQGDTRFEPRDVAKGDIARASFYFAVMYNKSIEPDEEAIFRQWHKSDPVDEKEAQRNLAIQQAQGSLNPFISQPELVDQIADF